MTRAFEFFEVDFLRAHAHSSDNHTKLSRSGLCGCFYCTDIFEFENIDEWTDHGRTALCPECGIDSVIGDAAGLPMTERFLAAMRDRFFDSEHDP